MATFKVWGHLYFYKKNRYSHIGFNVRRYYCGGSDTGFLPLLKFFFEEDDIMCGKPIFTSEDIITRIGKSDKRTLLGVLFFIARK